jgi:hypothetical protein
VPFVAGSTELDVVPIALGLTSERTYVPVDAPDFKQPVYVMTLLSVVDGACWDGF